MERLHWEPLYSEVTLESITSLGRTNFTKAEKRRLTALRTSFCQRIGLAEELVPLQSLRQFFLKHLKYACLPSQFPEASIVKDALPWHLVDAYRKSFVGEELPGSACALMRPGQYQDCYRALKVALESGCIALPRACGPTVVLYASIQTRVSFRLMRISLLVLR